MLKRIVPSMMLLAGGFGSLFAATADERDIHFQTVRELVESGMRLTAERQIDEFAKAGYPDAKWFEQGLRFAYADYYRTVVPQAIATDLEDQYAPLAPASKAPKINSPARLSPD